jgi:hypothetical protein
MRTESVQEKKRDGVIETRNGGKAGIKNRVYNLCDQSRNAVDWPEKYFDESWRSSHTKK